MEAMWMRIVARPGSPQEVDIRDATPDEAGMLEELQRRASLVWEEQRAQLLAHPDAISLPVDLIRDASVRVACDRDRVVGFTVTVASDADGGPDELDGLFVEPEYMRGGIGRALIADVVADAGRRGVSAIEVTANPRAVDFYRQVGFRDGETVSTRFGRGLRMRRVVDPAPGAR
jgi:GNAT superfamily N-acetyltransferase